MNVREDTIYLGLEDRASPIRHPIPGASGKCATLREATRLDEPPCPPQPGPGTAPCDSDEPERDRFHSSVEPLVRAGLLLFGDSKILDRDTQAKAVRSPPRDTLGRRGGQFRVLHQLFFVGWCWSPANENR